MQERLQECRKLMEMVEANKKTADSNKAIAQKNNKFFDAYQEFERSFRSYLIVKKYFHFVFSDKARDALIRVINETKKTFQMKAVLTTQYTQHVEQCIKQMKAEWEDFGSNYECLLKSDLEIAKVVVLNKAMVSNLISRLNKCQNWPVTEASAKDIFDAKSEAEAFLGQMKFDAYISAFLEKVSSHKATLTDLTPEVMNWLENKGLKDKIFISIHV